MKFKELRDERWSAIKPLLFATNSCRQEESRRVQERALMLGNFELFLAGIKINIGIGKPRTKPQEAYARQTYQIL
jgi:hypothetical protein